MNKKIVLLSLVVMFGAVVSANAANIFSDDFSHRTAWVPAFPGHFWPDPNKWEVTYDAGGWDPVDWIPWSVWWDIKPDWTTSPPQEPNNTSLWFLVLGQWSKKDDGDAGIKTKEYQNISGLSYLTVKCKVRLEAYGNPIIQVKINFWDNTTNLTPKGQVVKLMVDPNAPMARLTWHNYSEIITVPAGAGIAKFAINNDSRGTPIAEGTVWIDDFIVSDEVCMSPPALDFSGDCKVGFADVVTLASQWLTCGKANQAECW